MMSLVSQVEDNLQCLHPLEDLLKRLHTHHYQAEQAGQSIGQHVRHILEHYHCLWQAIDHHIDLDYELRPRQTELALSPAVALGDLTAHCHRMKSLKNNALLMHLNLNSVQPSQSQTVATSLVRELAFLASHTIHHQAIIKLLATQMGYALPGEFGVHNSTLKYWASQAEAR